MKLEFLRNDSSFEHFCTEIKQLDILSPNVPRVRKIPFKLEDGEVISSANIESYFKLNIYFPIFVYIINDIKTKYEKIMNAL